MGPCKVPEIFFIVLLCSTILTVQGIKTVIISWKNEPYLYLSNNTRTEGIIYDVLKELIHDCDEVNKFHEVFLPTHNDVIRLINPKLASDIEFSHNILQQHNNSLLIVTGTTYEGSFNKSIFQKSTILELEYVAIVVRARDVMLLVKLWSGINQCFILAYFALTITVITATVVWIFEHRVNKDFSPSFGKGLWTSIWFCFVTLSTVGYGDKVPKHFITQLICIVWLLFGMFMTGMTTATLIEEVQKGIKIDNQPIAVLNNTAEMQMVVKDLKARPVVYNSYEEVMEAVSDSSVQASLLDGYVAAILLEKPKFKSNLKVEEIRHKKLHLNMFIHHGYNQSDILHCIGDRNHMQHLSPSLKLKYIPSISETPYFTRSMSKIYDDSDGGLIKYSTITAGIIIFIAVMIETVKYISKKPKTNVDMRIAEEPHDHEKMDKLMRELKEIIAKMEMLEMLRQNEKNMIGTINVSE